MYTTFENSVKEAGITVSPYVTQSNGSIISIKETVDCPIKTAVSGPSAGVIGAIYIGKQCNLDKIITFDMGGTSIDVSLIENGKAQLSMNALWRIPRPNSYDRYCDSGRRWWLHCPN